MKQSYYIQSQEKRTTNLHMLICAQLTFSTLPQFRIPCLENGATRSGQVLINIINIILSIGMTIYQTDLDNPLLPQMILHCVKLTFKLIITQEDCHLTYWFANNEIIITYTQINIWSRVTYLTFWLHTSKSSYQKIVRIYQTKYIFFSSQKYLH